jgi:hypothetical protein
VGKGKASAAYLGHSFAHILKAKRQKSKVKSQKAKNKNQKAKNKNRNPKNKKQRTRTKRQWEYAIGNGR